MKYLALVVLLLAPVAYADPPFVGNLNTAKQLAKMPDLCKIIRRMPKVDPRAWNEDRCFSEAAILGFQLVNSTAAYKVAREVKRDAILKSNEDMLNPEFNGVGIGLPSR